MIRALKKFVGNPRKYAPLLPKLAQQRLCVIFRNTAFFMQGQMDIHPVSRWHVNEFTKATGGFYPKGDSGNRRICNLDPWDNTRRDMLVLFLRTIVDKQINGDIAEVGVYKGHTAKLIHHYMPERRLHLFDTFEGFTERSVDAEQKHTSHSVSVLHFADTSLGRVKDLIAQQNDNVFYYKGYFPDTVPEELGRSTFALVHLDADLYEPIIEGLRFFYPRMSEKGLLVVHDYNAWPGARKAVDEFFMDKPELPVPMPDKSGSVLIVKQSGGLSGT